MDIRKFFGNGKSKPVEAEKVEEKPITPPTKSVGVNTEKIETEKIATENAIHIHYHYHYHFYNEK